MMKKSDAASRSLHLVDPQLVPILNNWSNIELTTEMLVAMRDAAPPLLTANPEEVAARIQHEKRTIEGPPGAPEIKVEIYRPRSAPGSIPALLHIHGGGFIFGKAAWFEGHCNRLAAELACAVVSVDYRLAPETAAPGAVEDCYAALGWLLTNAASLGIDGNRVGIKGESAGGGLAAALALLVRDRREHALLFQHLLYPMLDDRTGARHCNSHAGEFIWTAQNNQFGWRALLGHDTGGADVSPYAAPARAEQLEGLPPTFIATGALDLFAEEDMEYARRLIRAGVPCELHVYGGAYHAFDVMNPDASASVALLRDSTEWMRRAFRTAIETIGHLSGAPP